MHEIFSASCSREMYGIEPYNFLFFKQFKETLKSSGTICYVLCLTLLIHFTLMFMVLAPFPRYALPMGPELYLMSMVALYRIAQMRNFRKEMQGIKGSNKMNKRQVLPGIRKKWHERDRSCIRQTHTSFFKSTGPGAGYPGLLLKQNKSLQLYLPSYRFRYAKWSASIRF